MSAERPAPPGFVRAAALVARKDLAVEGRTRESMAASLLFALIVLVVFAFAFDLDFVRRTGVSKIVPGMLWVTLAFSAIVGFNRSFATERARDALTGLAIAPVDRGAVLCGKAFANLTLLVLLEAAVIPLTGIFFDVDMVTAAPPLAAVVLLHSAGLAQLGTIFGAVVSRLGRGEAFLATLLLSAATPLFLSAVHCTATVFEGSPLAGDAKWLLITAGLDVLYFLVAWLLADAILEDA